MVPCPLLRRVRPRHALVALACAAAGLWLPLGWALGDAPRAAAVDGCASGDSAQITNGGFEAPVIPTGSVSLFAATGSGARWLTTATDDRIEYWPTGFNGVQAYNGTQFAELNANMPSALYQDVDTVPGEVYNWRLAHRGRAGVDTMAVRIGPPGATGTVVTLSDGMVWGVHSGTYTVPAGQTTTRFEFAAVSTASGSLSVGNLLDAIEFTPCALPSDVTSTTAGPLPTPSTTDGGGSSTTSTTSSTTTTAPGDTTTTTADDGAGASSTTTTTAGDGGGGGGGDDEGGQDGGRDQSGGDGSSDRGGVMGAVDEVARTGELAHTGINLFLARVGSALVMLGTSCIAAQRAHDRR